MVQRLRQYTTAPKSISDEEVMIALNSLRATARGLTPNAMSVNAPYFFPPQIASLYSFPAGDGTGQTIGIIELGGGYRMSDMIAYFDALGIVGTPNITDVSVNGAVNDPSDTSGANYEVVLDIQVIASIVPKAALRVYFAPNSVSSFLSAIRAAIRDGCNIISISWGMAELYWGTSNLAAYNSVFQTASATKIIFAASGDNGSSDGARGNNVDFPASSPFVIGCGGTNLYANTSYTTITSETTWAGSGGGVSKYFSKPAYQSKIKSIKSRGVPDVCGNANPSTGYIIYMDGRFLVIGGTSAVSPLYSALQARINQCLGRNISGSGFANTIYNNITTVARDVTTGSNGAYRAGVGWDACTGIGRLIGTALGSKL